MTTLPPPPRRVRRKVTVGWIVGWVSYLACWLGALGLGLALANELAYRFLGHDVTAAVTSLHEHPDGDGGFARVARYTYTPGPGRAPRADHARLDGRVFRELQLSLGKGMPDDISFPPDKPGALAVRAYTLGPIAYGRPVEHQFHDFFIIVPAGFFPIFALLTFVIHRGLIVRGRERRRIFVHGVAVPGTIVGQREDHSGDQSVVLADYTYTPANAAEPISAAHWIRTRFASGHATPGQTVTVLYDPADPTDCTIYEYGEFRVA